MIMKIKDIILEEIFKLNKEGVGDKYAAQKFGIPDSGTDFEKRYSSKLDREKEKNIGEFVTTVGHDNVNIFKNPLNLNKFEADVRAISDKEGNLFIAQEDGLFYHGKMGNAINDTPSYNIGEAYNNIDNITWHRIGKTNEFAYSDSYDLDFGSVEKNQPYIRDLLKKISNKHPQYEFIPEYWLDITDNYNVNNIVDEEINDFLNEGDVDWAYYERKDEKMMNLFHDFLFKNNHDFTKTVKWSVIKYPRLKKIWEDFMRYGFVRDVKGLDMIEQRMVNNVMKVEIFTELAGHTSYDPEEDFDQAFRVFIENQIDCYRIETTPFDKDQLEIDFEHGKEHKKKEKFECKEDLHPYIKEFIEKNEYNELSNEELYEKIDEQLRFKFYEYYMEDPKSGQAYISDYGLDPLLKLVDELRQQTKPEDKLVTLDKMLNVVHMRSDIAAWFVEGGSETLTDLSGYEHDDGSGVMKKDVENA